MEVMELYVTGQAEPIEVLVDNTGGSPIKVEIVKAADGRQVLRITPDDLRWEQMKLDLWWWRLSARLAAATVLIQAAILLRTTLG